MPRNAYQKGFSYTVDHTDGVAQFIPVIGSEDYTRFCVEVSFSGAGNATLLGAVIGSASQSEKSDIPIADPGYVKIMGSDGDPIMDEATSGVYSFKLASFIGGGVVLHLQALDAAATVKVQMMGNVFGGPSVSRGV